MTGRLGQRRILLFWLPLALTWVMMACEQPYITAIVARLPETTENLAAFGIAFSIAILVEAPVIMMLGAATGLAHTRPSYLRLRNFTFALNGIITLVMALLLATPAIDLVTAPFDPRVAELVQGALLIFLPWPGAIGFRRFYQGVIIRHDRARLVTLTTVIRLAAMSLTCLLLFTQESIPGAYVGAGGLSLAVSLEAVAAFLLSRRARSRVLALPGEPITYREIAHFYYPLALTAVVALTIHPLVNFMVEGSRLDRQSLAVIPVVNALGFLFRSQGLAFQEVAISLAGEKEAHRPELTRFALVMGLGLGGLMAFVVFTPLGPLWFEGVTDLEPELAGLAREMAGILVLFPPLSFLTSLLRGLLVVRRRTGPVNQAALIEVTGVFAALWAGIHLLDLAGAHAAGAALVTGRLFSLAWLLRAAR